MNTKVLAIATVALGATALGGVLLFSSGNSEPEEVPASGQQDRLATASNFDSMLPTAQPEPAPERAEINTAGRSSGNTSN
ncbi:unnamed protein product, partial [Laminaria digitata]